MPLLMLKDLPRYDCLLEAAREFPDLDPSATEVFLHLLRAGDDAFRMMETHRARYGLSQGGFSVLLALWQCCRRASCPQEARLTPAELADHTAVTRATITGVVDTLEKGGLVTRAAHHGDRRRITVGLTPRAEKLLRAVCPGHFQRMAWLMEPLTEAERKSLVRLLGKVTARAAEEPPRSRMR